MRFAKPAVAGALVAAIAAGAVLAGSHEDAAAKAGLKARQAHMQLYAHNLGILGAMAKGEADYDAGAAQAAADNLAMLTTMNQMSYWVPGSDSSVFEESRLKPVLFENVSDAMSKGQALAEAAAKMQGVAGGGLDGVRATIGEVGGACGGCHKAYRIPADQ